MSHPSVCPQCGSASDRDAERCRSCAADLTDPTKRVSAAQRQVVETLTTSEFSALATDLTETLGARFQNVRLLGKGGMGVVFLAHDPALQRDVAVKVLAPDAAADPTARKRFVREAQAAASVAHPNVVNIHQVGALHFSDAPYFVMQFVEGRTLDLEFPRGSPVAESVAQRIIADVASALAAAHERQLVHRDIKPSNIIVEAHSGRAIVLDFGISAAIRTPHGARDTKLTDQGISIGTPQYMSPEQAEGHELSGQSDVYSLGLVAFELLTGRPVFEERSPMALVAAHIGKEAPRLVELRPELNPALADVVQRCLTKQPELRPSAREIGQVLQLVAPTIQWPPPGLGPLSGALARAGRAAAAAMALAAALFLLAGLAPASVRPHWNAAESLLFGALMVFAPSDWSPTPVWVFLVVGTMLGLVLASGSAALRAVSAGRQLLRARLAGYPWHISLDVSIDTHAETAQLLNGLGAYARISAPERARLMRLRRIRFGLYTASLPAAILSVWLWYSGATNSGNFSAPLVSLGDAFALVLLPLGALIAAVVAGTTERRLLRSTPRPQQRPSHVVSPELVKQWLTLSSQAPSISRPSKLGRLVSLSPGVVVLAGLGGLAMLTLTVALIALSPAGRSLRGRPAAQDWLRSLTIDSLRPPSFASLDSIVAASGIPRLAAPDVAAERRLIAWGLAGTTANPNDSVFAADSAIANRPRVERRSAGGAQNTRVWQLPPQRLTDPLRAALETDSLFPGLRDFRAVATAAESAPFWYYRVDVAFLPSLYWQRGVWFLGDIANKNLSASRLAIERNDGATALRRIRENIAVGRRLLNDPGLLNAVTGRGMVYDAAVAMAVVAAVTKSAALATEATTLRVAAEQLRTPFQKIGITAGSLMADPVDPPGLALIATRALPPAVRVSIATFGSLAGICLNPREILFGTDPRRHDALARADTALRDVAGALRIIALARKDLDAVVANPSSYLASSGLALPLPARGTGRVSSRWGFCIVMADWANAQQ